MKLESLVFANSSSLIHYYEYAYIFAYLMPSVNVAENSVSKL